MNLTAIVALGFALPLSAQGLITPLGPDPTVGLSRIATNFAGLAVQRIDQIELQPDIPGGVAGVYRVCCTVSISGFPDTDLLTGFLDLRLAPPVWTPTNEVDQLSTANGTMPTQIQDDFQLSMSPDGLVVTWDNYRTGPVAGFFTFVCRRASTGVPFQRANALAITTLTGIWHDCSLGPPLGNGRYELFFSDAVLGASPAPPRDIMRGELDPATGIVFNVSLVKTRPAGMSAAHSPGVLRDSTGVARALTFGQLNPSGTASDMLWTTNMVDTGATFMIANSALSNMSWFSNGCTNGGSFRFGGPFPAPFIAEHTILADTIPIPGPVRIAGWAPIRPAALHPVFLSAVAIGNPLPPFPLPPVLEPIGIAPSIGITPLGFHDRFTGLAEWAFTVPPSLYLPGLVAQMITIDLSTNALHASNLATF